MTRGVFALVGLAATAVAAGVTYQRLAANRRTRLDVYFADGSFVTYREGSAAAEELLSVARQVLAAVRA